MISVSEFRVELFEEFFARRGVGVFCDRDKFSVVDAAVVGDDGEVAAFRIVILALPPVFADEELTASRIEKYIDVL